MSVSRSAGALSYRSSEDTSLPEILLGLIYNSATGQLSAEVIKGSYFKTAVSDKPVSTYEWLWFLFICVTSQLILGKLEGLQQTLQGHRWETPK